MSGQEFEGEANMSWSNNGDSDHSSPGNGVSESNQPSPVSTPSSRWELTLEEFHLVIILTVSLRDAWGQCRRNSLGIPLCELNVLHILTSLSALLERQQLD